jgi:hypothetical protein
MARFRLGLALGLGAGYVLGTKAGRERYLQIQRWAHRLEKVANDLASSSIGRKIAAKTKDGLGGGLGNAKAATLAKIPWMKDRVADQVSRNGFEEREPASSF